MQYALGIDGGGSKCDAVLVDTKGHILGWGRGGQVQPFYDSIDNVRQSFLCALDGALGDLCGAELWVSNPMRRRSRWVERVEQAGVIQDVACTPEQDTALAAAEQDWGVVVLAGTGSFVHGLTPDGRRLHLGAMGPVLGDYGSGYEIGLAGMRAAFASHWTARRETSLAQVIPPALGLEDLHRVFHKVYIDGLQRRQIASLARLVNEQAEAGDRIAIAILREAADALFELLEDLVHELGLAEAEFPLVAAGSVAAKSRLWWERMCERAGERFPGARPVKPRLMMAVGAALLSLRRMGVEWTPELLANLERTQDEFLAQLETPGAAGAVATEMEQMPVSLDGKWS